MPGSQYRARWAESRKSNRRAVAFLLCDEDKVVNAVTMYERLKDSRRRDFLTRFEEWVDGKRNNLHFHGFTGYNGKYSRTFVFKAKERHTGLRFYGFLCHPDPDDRRFEVCVLVVYATKNERETEVSELDRVEERRTIPEVVAAVERLFEAS